MAKQALKLWPEAADAYVILGNEAMDHGDLQSAHRFNLEGMQAGERVLGRDFFAENLAISGG